MQRRRALPDHIISPPLFWAKLPPSFRQEVHLLHRKDRLSILLDCLQECILTGVVEISRVRIF